MINVLPTNQKKMVERLRVLRLVSVTLWAAVLLIIVAVLLLLPLLVTINSRYSLANMQLLRLEETGAVINPIDASAIAKQAQDLGAKLAADSSQTPIEYIGIVRLAATNGITLSGFSMQDIKNKKLEIAGSAATREALQRFIAVLQKSPGVKTVESPVSNFVKSTNSTFVVTITFE
jgi:hypothetical protein